MAGDTERVNVTTGEVLPAVVERFNLGEYLTRIQSPEGMKQQQALASAYDAACRALIGPNDVQKEGGREFKKKSAWRKLQRHFNISTQVMTVERWWESVEGQPARFLATVAVRASAPWGQYAEAVGACGQDEESGRRKITLADAIATAETRATNRAVSNLIAMGEVSAEEMQKGDRASGASETVTLESVVQFGKHKGKTVKEAGLPYFEFIVENAKKDGKAMTGWASWAADAVKAFESEDYAEDDMAEVFAETERNK